MKRFTAAATLATALAFVACAAPNDRSTETKTTGFESAGADEPGAPPPQDGGITWNLTPRNAYVLGEGNHESYIYLNVRSGANANEKPRMPLNISLVLDRSGSMAGLTAARVSSRSTTVTDAPNCSASIRRRYGVE